MAGFTRRTLASLALSAAVATPGAALAWAAGTHAYIAKHTDKKGDQVDANEMCNRIYGSNATDLFNYDFTPNGQKLAAVMHDRDRLVPLLPWGVAAGANARVRAFAFGMASHNDTWGTDSTAHWAGITFGKDDGYVVAKAKLLREELKAMLPPGLAFTDAQLLLVAHVFVEYGVDILVAGVDPTVGTSLVEATACARPDGELPGQLAVLLATLVPELSKDVGAAPAADEIVRALPLLLADIGGRGYVLASYPPEQAVTVFAAATAAHAEDFLGLPAGALEPIRGQLQAIAAYGISRGIELCAPDFRDELEATLGRVNGKMSSLGISP